MILSISFLYISCICVRLIRRYGFFCCFIFLIRVFFCLSVFKVIFFKRITCRWKFRLFTFSDPDRTGQQVKCHTDQADPGTLPESFRRIFKRDRVCSFCHINTGQCISDHIIIIVFAIDLDTPSFIIWKRKHQNAVFGRFHRSFKLSVLKFCEL